MSAVPVVLGFKPSSHGFAWVAFSSPFSINDWGVVDVRADKNARCLERFEQLIGRFSAHTLVIEAFEGAEAKVSQRVERLYRAVIALATAKGIDVVMFGRKDVRACFVNVGARTRHEVASAIARSFEILRDLLPEKRRPWEPPHRRMALFDAAAVVLTHFHLGASQLFDDLLARSENGSEVEEG